MNPHLILPKRKNMIPCCIYQHPTSTMPVRRFNNDYILPSLPSHLFAPYILQLIRPISKSLIDNILINSVEFPSHSGKLSDHLFQFVILEGFF